MQRTKSNTGRNGVVLAILLLAAAACAPATDERSVLRQTLRSMEAALEDKDRSAFLQHLSGDFLAQGRLDRAKVDSLLRLQFLRNRHIGIVVSNVHLTLLSDTAELRFKALATGTSGWLPERGRVVQMRTQWRKQGGAWRMVRAEWRDMLERG